MLYVEDSPSNRRVLTAYLECEGYVVDAAGSVTEAIRLLDSGRAYRVALIDLNLGTESGLGLIPLLRAGDAPARVLLISGDTMKPEARALADDVFEKGQAVELLLEAIARLAG